MGKVFSHIAFLLLFFSQYGYSEGTKQIAPFYSAQGQLCLDMSRNSFGFFNADSLFRINIHIASSGEKFCFGLGRISQADTLTLVQYRVRDPQGNIVIGPYPVPKSGKGFISSYDQDTVGPFPAKNGYDPIEHTPLMTGNYSLEFYYPPDQNPYYTFSSFVMFKYFDITVLAKSGVPINGRVWSRAWQFNCGPVEPPPTASRFYGTMYILSDDSIVTSLNCNGFVGGTFSISSNQTGCSSTGNLTVDRQSRHGFHTYPQYKVFLSPPDSIVFPTGKAKPAISLPVTIGNDCATGSVDLGIKVSQDGIVEVLIEMDPAPGANPRDVKLTANVSANPGGSGYNTIHWNGKDGLGKPVANGTVVNATIRFVHGITHLPIYDIEYNDVGYIVDVVRPAGPKPDIFWDDTLLSEWSTADLTGCSDVIGCHTWSIESGDTNTINSWWYVASSASLPFSFIVKRIPGQPSKITGDASFCAGGITRIYSIHNEPSSSTYNWSYTGTGVSITVADTTATVVYSSQATTGILSVYGYNPECGSGPATTLPIIFHQAPLVSLTGPDTICYNEPAIALTGGAPDGGSYLVDGIPQTAFDPAQSGSGPHELTYIYADNHGCKNSDSVTVFVDKGIACEIIIWVPNAFTPNGDGHNDVFRPVTQNVKQLTMSVFNRTGELLFQSTNQETGWDGKIGGNTCPSGNYVYIIVYQSSLAPPENKTLTGNVSLIR